MRSALLIWGLVTSAGLFLAAGLLARVMGTPEIAPVLKVMSLALGLAALAALSHPTPLFHMVFALALTYWVFLIGLARAPRLLAYNRLGYYSYGTYIYAFPVQQVMAYLGVTLPLTNMALAFPATLVLAMLSWHLIERPALALVRRPARQEQRT